MHNRSLRHLWLGYWNLWHLDLMIQILGEDTSKRVVTILTDKLDWGVTRFSYLKESVITMDSICLTL